LPNARQIVAIAVCQSDAGGGNLRADVQPAELAQLPALALAVDAERLAA
jgi:hypothetical protein